MSDKKFYYRGEFCNFEDEKEFLDYVDKRQNQPLTNQSCVISLDSFKKDLMLQLNIGNNVGKNLLSIKQFESFLSDLLIKICNYVSSKEKDLE